MLNPPYRVLILGKTTFFLGGGVNKRISVVSNFVIHVFDNIQTHDFKSEIRHTWKIIYFLEVVNDGPCVADNQTPEKSLLPTINEYFDANNQSSENQEAFWNIISKRFHQ